MKKHEAEKLVNETLTQPYEEQRFRGLVVNLFNDIEQLTEQASSGQYIFEAFRDKIISFKRIAKFIDPENLELDVLAVKVKNKHLLDNARTTQRNFVARYLTKKALDAALVAFYSDDSEDWRFSLIRMDYAYDEQKKKLVKEITPSRRYSFLVGKNEKSYTARKQLVPILENEFETTIQSIENAFSIEKVTKEFFEQYKELFLRLTEELDKVRGANPAIDNHLSLLGIQTVDFCKKLLGQIVFLYFLQKKGWLGVDKNKKWGDGDKNFLRSLFEDCQTKGHQYFDGYLEPLFYEALATDDRDGDYYSRFDCRIPFLNGGLFEPTNSYSWQQYDFNIPNELFANGNKTKAGDTGDGILDVFDRYNFTVREDESLEKEVAVDPEMLGKVFENLLEVKDRKSKGAFYTPREIVHYMCQESLINYLDTKLNIQIKPVENKKQPHLLPELIKTDLLTEYQEIYNPIVSKDDIHYLIHHGDSARENDSTASIKSKNEDYKGDYQFQIPESIRKYAKEIDKALADVKICDPAIGSGAFPVGIMHEIVRARLTLLEANLVKQTKKANAYEYKRQAIQQSIYGVDIDESAIEIAKLRLWLSLVVDETDMEEIKPLPNLKYKIVKGNSLIGIDKGDLFKHAQLKRLEELKELYFDETSKGNKKKYEKEISEIIKSFAKDGQFDFEIFFSEVFRKNAGFDIVIANPPYVRQEDIKELKPILKKRFKVFTGTADLYTYFYEISYNLLAKKGISTYITSNKWMRAKYGELLRKFIKSNVSINQLIDFGGTKIFDTATVDTNILIFSKSTPFANHTFRYKLNKLPSSANDMSSVLQKDMQESEYSLLDENKFKLKKKIENNGLTISKLGIKIFRGILTGANDAFIIDTKKKNELIASDPKSAEIIVPVLRGRDISKYGYEWNNLWLINAHNGFANIKRIDVQKDYPAIYQHLLKCEEESIKKAKEVESKGEKKKTTVSTRSDKGTHWTNLRNCAYVEEFKKNKVFVSEFGYHFCGAYDDKGYYCSDTAHIILCDKFTLSVLNSSVIHFYLSCIATGLGQKGIRFKPQFIERLPIATATKDIRNSLELFANKASNSKSSEEKNSYEREINKIVYQLYNLTPDEITTVEEAIK